jgi:putative aminopeptidase FrvX
MFDKQEITFLQELLTTPSPVGYEAAGQRVWMNHVKPKADGIITDVYGSAAAHLDINSDAITVMLEAHCDEIGMVVQYVDSNGFVYINRIGGSDPSIARAKKVFIHTGKGIVSGVIGNTAIHMQDKGNQKVPSWKDLFIDIGASDKAEALEMVQIGDPITYSDDLEFLTNELVVGRALDNRIGGFIIAHAFNTLAKRRDELKVNVLALNSVQEEIGGYGARMMSYRLSPDVALVTDVTHATDTPGIDVKEHGEVKLGKGPSVSHGTANQVRLVQKLVQVAEAKKIEIQHEASSIRTGTDTDSIFHSKSGIASALISTPMRYMHSPVEMVSLEDVKAVSDLMVETVLSFAADESFRLL